MCLWPSSWQCSALIDLASLETLVAMCHKIRRYVGKKNLPQRPKHEIIRLIRLPGMRLSHNRQDLIFGRFAMEPFFLDAAFSLTVGSFLLTVELFYLQLTILAFLLTVGAFLLTILAFLLTVGAFLLTVGKCF